MCERRCGRNRFLDLSPGRERDAADFEGEEHRDAYIGA
jgi:hypothetical protein